MRLFSLVLFTTFAVAITFQAAFAQGGFVPVSEEYIAQRQEAYKVTSSSANDLNAIPQYEVYRAVFTRILGNPFLLQQVDDADLETLLKLPDHNDAQFLGPLQNALREACSEINKARDQKEAHELVSIFLAAEKSYQEALSDHYMGFLTTLSDATNLLVSNQLVKLSESNSLIHTSTDYVGFSEEFPELMKTKVLSGCVGILADLSVSTSRLLTDDFVHRDNFKLDPR